MRSRNSLTLIVALAGLVLAAAACRPEIITIVVTATPEPLPTGYLIALDYRGVVGVTQMTSP